MPTVSNETILASLRTNGLDISRLAGILDLLTNDHPSAHLLKAHFAPAMLRLNTELRRRINTAILVSKLGIMSVREPYLFVRWYINMFDRHYVPGSDGSTLIEIYTTVTTAELFEVDYAISSLIDKERSLR